MVRQARHERTVGSFESAQMNGATRMTGTPKSGILPPCSAISG